MKKTVVINVVALTEGLLGAHMPFLSRFAQDNGLSHIKPVLPAVTCTAQACYLTGKWPEDHGIVANGWYFRDECEIKLWRQSNKLVTAEKIWERLKKEDSTFTCANIFWWYNMYSSVDYSVTPRPIYLADGRKMPDCYTQPSELRDELQLALGQFPLFKFWGPMTTVESSKWIADSAKYVDKKYDPTLSLIYIPHLDYNLQKFGIDLNKISKDLKEVDDLCADLIKYYQQKDAEIIIVSEYGITDVDDPVHINRILRKKGWLKIREERGLELLDAGASKAFAMADHQVAHIYLNDLSILDEVKSTLIKEKGIAQVLDAPAKKDMHLDHERSGELIVVADKKSWFTYYYWMDDEKAPDFARTVDIHKKPGYDPVELFTDPDIRFLKASVGIKLLKRKMGFRQLMDVIPLNADLVKGSHGRIPEEKSHWPVLIGGKSTISGELQAVDVYEQIYSTIKR